jgi:transposase
MVTVMPAIVVPGFGRLYRTRMTKRSAALKREHAIRDAYLAGLSAAEAARLLGIGETTARTHFKRFRADGLVRLAERPVED